MKFLITGGAGFIGSHFAEHLIAKGHGVSILDNFSAKGCRKVEGIDWVYNEDLRNAQGVHAILAQYQPDVVIHLAANTDIPNGRINPALDYSNCIEGTYNLLEAMRRLEMKRLLFASTAAVYGDIPSRCTEDYGPLLPISLYGGAKLACEGLVSAYAHLYGIQSSIFRFANVVGGGMDHGVIFDLIEKLRANPEELHVWGDGQGRKPFFLVDDCIWGMMCVLSAMDSTIGTVKPCDVFNLGPGNNILIEEVVAIVIETARAEKLIAASPLIHYAGGRHGFPGDVPTVTFSAYKMSALGWQARHSSRDAVAEAARRIIRLQR